MGRRSSTTEGELVDRRHRHRARPTPTSCGWAPARTTTARARRGATASTSPPTAAAPGRTWASRDSRHIARIIVDPVDLDVVYVAALGDLWGAGGERGVYKTTDGGADLEAHAVRGRRHRRHRAGDGSVEQQGALRRHLPAAPRQWGIQRRRPGQRASGSRPTAGATWTKLDERHPGRAEGPHRPRRLSHATRTSLYARIEHATESGVYRSDDAGATLAQAERRQPAPDVLQPDPHRPATTTRASTCSACQLHVSDDGGKTFRDDGAERIHVDHHAMWINPANPNHMIDRQRRRRRHLATTGRDLGLAAQHDLRRSSTTSSFDMQTPYHVCGGLQDNNTWCGPSAVRSRQRHRQRRLVHHQRRRRLRSR